MKQKKCRACSFFFAPQYQASHGQVPVCGLGVVDHCFRRLDRTFINTKIKRKLPLKVKQKKFAESWTSKFHQFHYKKQSFTHSLFVNHHKICPYKDQLCDFHQRNGTFLYFLTVIWKAQIVFTFQFCPFLHLLLLSDSPTSLLAQISNINRGRSKNS